MDYSKHPILWSSISYYNFESETEKDRKEIQINEYLATFLKVALCQKMLETPELAKPQQRAQKCNQTS